MRSFFLSRELWILFFVLQIASSIKAQNSSIVDYVNPKIGTGGHGHTFPGATVPFGMVQLSPDTRIDGSWDGCSGYHDSDSLIYGFSHTHLSGTGCSDYGDVAFLPFYIDKKKSEVVDSESLPIKLSSTFSKVSELASVGYYQVKTPDILVELTAAAHSGFQRYSFDKKGIICISLNLGHRDELLDGNISKVSETNYKGFRRSKAWAENQLLYFYFNISKKPFYSKVHSKDNKDIVLQLFFDVAKGEQILLKTAISSVDEMAAKNNLLSEIADWNFNKIHSNAIELWAMELNKIKVVGEIQNDKIKFYTALYHSMLHPSIMSDVDQRYRGRDGLLHQADGNYYTVFSLWDTHRALHPLLTIIDKARTKDFIKSFLAQFQQSGRMPMWELWNNETNCMIGFHSVSIILDAYRKGAIDKLLLKEIFPAVKSEAMNNRFGLDEFRERGYLQIEDESESVSKTLEYAYDMWCVSEIAQILNLKEEENYFRPFSYAWQNVYDYKTGYMRPRKNGGWLEPFNPYEVNNHYTEANAWQYSYFIPHRVVKPTKLLELFKAEKQTTGREQSDITGLIGQYAHGNEPSHNYVYLLPTEEKQKYAMEIMNSLYGIGADGLCGNDDCGQMSAWFVFSAMGFYPACPGKSEYEVGIPLFDEVNIHLENDSVFKIKKMSNRIPLYASVIEKKGNSQTSKKSDFESPMLVHTSIENGATLFFKETKNEIVKLELNNDTFSLTAPIISAKKQVFKDTITISLFLPDQKVEAPIKLFYSFDSTDYLNFIPYDSPFVIDKSSSIFAYSVKGKERTKITKAKFYQLPNNWSVTYNCTYNKQYSADGPEGLIDGLRGDTDWRKGRWQGFQSQDFEIVVDLKEIKNVREISTGFLQDIRSWIFMPKKVAFYSSIDNINFTLIATIANTISEKDYSIKIHDFKAKVDSHKAKYIKIKAVNYGILPTWHQGAGYDAFVFVDEIEVR